MANSIKLKSSNTPGAVPASLLDGEIAINRADRLLYFKDANGNIVSKSLANEAGAVGITTVEVDLTGSGAAVRAGSFQITGTGFTPGKMVIISQAPGPYTGKGTLADEAECDPITVSGYVLNATTIQCYWSCPFVVRGNFKFNYFIQS